MEWKSFRAFIYDNRKNFRENFDISVVTGNANSEWKYLIKKVKVI